MPSQYFDFIISTGRFNLSKPGEHFINECCYGEDLAAWLAQVLNKDGITASEPDQEDWGWYITAAHKGDSYFIAISGDSDGHEEMPNQGEWRISIHKPRSLMDKLMIRNFMSTDEAILLALRRILKQETDIKIIDTESSIA